MRLQVLGDPRLMNQMRQVSNLGHAVADNQGQPGVCRSNPVGRRKVPRHGSSSSGQHEARYGGEGATDRTTQRRPV